MENFVNSPLGRSLVGKFLKTKSPTQKVTHALSDIHTNSPTKQVADVQAEVETRSEPQPDTDAPKKKLIPEPSPQSTPTAQQIEEAVREAFEAGVNEGVRSRNGSAVGSYVSDRTNRSRMPSIVESRIIDDPRNYDAASPDVMANQSMFDPTVITTNQSRRNKSFKLSFPQPSKAPSQAASDRGSRTSTMPKPQLDVRRNSDVSHSAIVRPSTPELGKDRKPVQDDNDQQFSGQGPKPGDFFKRLLPPYEPPPPQPLDPNHQIFQTQPSIGGWVDEIIAKERQKVAQWAPGVATNAINQVQPNIVLQTIKEDQDVANLNDVFNNWDQGGDGQDANKVIHHAYAASKTSITKAIMAARKARSTKTFNPKASYDRLEKAVEVMLDYGGRVMAVTTNDEKAKVKSDLSGGVQVANDALAELQTFVKRQQKRDNRVNSNVANTLQDRSQNSQRPSPTPSGHIPTHERNISLTQSPIQDRNLVSNATIYTSLRHDQTQTQTHFRPTQAQPMSDEEYYAFMERKRVKKERAEKAEVKSQDSATSDTSASTISTDEWRRFSKRRCSRRR